MIIFILAVFSIFTIPAEASVKDGILSELIQKTGLFDGNNGIIYADEYNDNMAVVEISNNSLICTVYGTENEITDSISFNIGGDHTYKLSLARNTDGYAIIFNTDNIQEVFTLINDAFTVSDYVPKTSDQIASYSNGKLKIYADPYDVYDTVNKIKMTAISQIPYPNAELDPDDTEELMNLIKSCADIMDYDSNDYDLDTLTRHVLYTRENFRLLTDLSPMYSKGGNINMCSTEFIDDVMYKAFRLKPERPPVNMLTHLGYCVNGNSYNYTGGYNVYFATDIKNIIRTVKGEDNNIFIVFSDTYTEGDKKPIFEYSTALAKRDSNGFYITQLHMGGSIEFPSDFKPVVPHEKEILDVRPILLAALLLSPAIYGTVRLIRTLAR